MRLDSRPIGITSSSVQARKQQHFWLGSEEATRGNASTYLTKALTGFVLKGRHRVHTRRKTAQHSVPAPGGRARQRSRAAKRGRGPAYANGLHTAASGCATMRAMGTKVVESDRTRGRRHDVHVMEAVTDEQRMRMPHERSRWIRNKGRIEHSRGHQTRDHSHEEHRRTRAARQR